jgi:hypothetical protein
MMAQEREGANGLEINHAISEFIDNSFDAGARKCSIAMIPTTAADKNYLAVLDTGEGMADPFALYGIGSSVTKKPAGSRGLKNYGYRAAVGRLSPASILNIARKAGTRCSTLKFDLGTLYAAIDRANATGRCNYPDIDATILSDVLCRSPLTVEACETLDAVLAAMRAPGRDYGTMTATLQHIRNSTQPSFCLHLLEYAAFPVDLEEHLVEAFKSYCLTHYKDLRGGRELEFFGIATPALHYTAAHACDPLGPSTVPRLTGRLEFRIPVNATDTKIAPHFIGLTLTDAAATETFYATCDVDTPVFRDRKGVGSPFSRCAPAGWDIAVTTSTQALQISVPNKATETAQMNQVGSTLYDSVEDTRGVYLNYAGRILGKPLYSARWEKRRNVSALRVELSANDQVTAENYWAIQTRKHISVYENLHRALQMSLNWLVNNIIIKHRSFVNTTCGTGVADWHFSGLCQLMINQRHRETTLPVVPVPVPDPDPVTTDESDAESESSASSGSSAAAALTEEVHTIVHKGAPAALTEEVHTVVHKGEAAPAPVPIVAHTRAAPPKFSQRDVLLKFISIHERLAAAALPTKIAAASDFKIKEYVAIMRKLAEYETLIDMYTT